jgi:hypothetical protein
MVDFCVRSNHRDMDGEAASIARRRLHLHLASMGLDDGLHDMETQTRTGDRTPRPFSAVEFLEDAGPLPRVEAATVVSDRKAEGGTGAGNGEQNTLIGTGVFVGVLKQVQQRGGERRSIGLNQGELTSDLGAEVAARSSESARRIYDIRLALTLRHHGVSHFATVNRRDFKGFGFEKVWNPLS